MWNCGQLNAANAGCPWLSWECLPTVAVNGRCHFDPRYVDGKCSVSAPFQAFVETAVALQSALRSSTRRRPRFSNTPIVSACFEMGSGPETSLAKALALEQKVLRDNDPHAMADLGVLLLEDRQFASQRQRGAQMLERAVKQSQLPFAMYALADHLLKTNERQCHRRAVSLLECSLKLEENSTVVNRLADCYFTGQGVARNFELALQLSERALRIDNNPFVMGSVAIKLLLAPNLVSQRKRAVKLFERALDDSSDAQLMYILAMFYHFGTANLSPNVKRACKLYRRAIRISNHPSSMHNLAFLMLAHDPSNEDVEQAVQLLEDAVEQQRGEDEETMLRLAYTYLEYSLNFGRALHLYETAAIRLDSGAARRNLAELWVGDIYPECPDSARILRFCWDDLTRNKDLESLKTYAEMIWTGAEHIQSNRKKALYILSSYSNSWTEHWTLSLMLRHDLGAFPSGEKHARRLMNEYNNNIDRSCATLAEAIILSESNCEDDKLLAMQIFIAERDHHGEQWLSWLAPNLRVGRYRIPFDGHLDCVTNPMRRFTRWKNIALLNLASLLLEIEGKQQEAATRLEDLMDSDLRLIAMLNLAYILMKGVSGVTQDRARGLQLLEDAVKETNEISARAMLANALAEQVDSVGYDVERGWKMWQQVVEEEDSEEELRKLRRLLSTSSQERWRVHACQLQEVGKVDDIDC